MTPLAKKAQIISQVFVLILAAIVFILILSYGYSALNNIWQRSEQVAFIDFSTTLQSEVKAISLSYGSVKKLDLSGLPTKYKTICVVTGEKKDRTADSRSGAQLEGLPLAYPLIYELYEPGGANVFFVPSAPQNIKLPNIEASPNPDGSGTKKWFCIPVDRGDVTLRLEGLGNSVRVSPWS